ncbi:hypothetical protein QBC39DRAFT_349437 [Podospora conica]|nr:hypothetical protein QBC39DRAFT_349437 [Schizothecium conicum]
MTARALTLGIICHHVLATDTATCRRQHFAMSLPSHVAPALGTFFARLSLHGVNELSAMARVLRRLPSNRGTRSTNNGRLTALSSVIRSQQSKSRPATSNLYETVAQDRTASLPTELPVGKQTPQLLRRSLAAPDRHLFSAHSPPHALAVNAERCVYWTSTSAHAWAQSHDG